MFSRTGHSLLDESQTRYEGGRSSPGAPHLQMLMTLSMGVLVGAAAVFGASRLSSAPVTAAVVPAGGPSTELTGTVSALRTLVADLQTEVGEMKRQKEQRSTKAAAGPEAQPAAATSLSEKGWIPSIPFLQPAALPSKYIVKHTPPVKLQHLRGACWLFGISGVLEASYRKQGIAYGFMQPDEYLRLTEQNLGAQIESACRATTKYWKLGSLNDKAVCFTGDGDTAWKGNSTEGGEAEWIWYLKEWLEDTMALPESVCPYLEKEEGNSSAICVGSEAAIKKSALKMKIKGMKAYYGLADLKRSIFENERYQAFSIALFGQNYPLPCTDATKDYYKCDPAGPLCTKCPAEANYAGVECCVLQARFGTNMKGEFSGGHGGQFTAAGGHAVGYVGWNDNFFSSHGYKGGLIIKNSWWDGVPPPGIVCTDPTAPCSAGRGSHSLPYYMEEISSVAEREICPNVHSPASWYACADIATCTSVDSNISAVATRKVLHLECLGDGDQSPYVKGICKAGEKFFFKNMTDFGSGLSVACMVKGDGSGDLCLPPLWDEDLAMLFTPVPEEDKPNDPDQCGYYWFPYDIYGKVAATMEKSYGVDFDIVWPKSAYVNAPKYFKDVECPGCDYEVIKKNTHKQRTPPFTGPFPTLREPLKKE